MTDKPSFTLGPWQRRELNSTTRVYAPKALNREVCSLHKPLSPHHRNEMQANAHLIAAAPDLYEALEEAADEVFAAGGNKAINLDSAWLEKARAALRLARGEQS